MTWRDIGRELGISGEYARMLAASGMAKIRRRAPHLADVIEAALRIADRRSPAQRCIDANTDNRADGDNWGGNRWDGVERKGGTR